ncbi:hypothetical protein JKF63_03163 [Porcisia hertigi]|uniref:Uncharacterized protein n=1 Tax=Porcisia hertigi TaxID=2761500 RepID=A0A836L5C1_9TRYP|nr:hypothetical protein JKF63_03163 [Porcisia hertigi]
MFRRTCITALQRSSLLRAAAVSKTAPAAQKAPPVTKAPEMTTQTGASATGGDTVMDKVLLTAALGSLVVWWMTVPGPQHQH